jgi:cytochrome c-type biogenesis protein CcmE
MSSKALRILLSVTVISVALGGLFYTTLASDTQYYKHVDEVMTNPQSWYGKKLQVHGYVVEKSILQRPDTLDYKFKVQNNGQVIDVAFTGVKPDTFKDGAEVVVTGRLDAQGFHASEVTAKCPSKYQPAGVGSAGR